MHLKCVGKEEEAILPAEKENLIIYFYKTSHKSEKYPLQGDYGYMIFNEGSEENPKPRFELYLNKEKKIYKEYTLDSFAMRLSEIPQGSIVEGYTTCTLPTYWGLDYETIASEIQKIGKQKGLQIKDITYVICTCPY